jgi:hypothetical protein
MHKEVTLFLQDLKMDRSGKTYSTRGQADDLQYTLLKISNQYFVISEL